MKRNSAQTSTDLYTQMVKSDGTIVWQNNGVIVVNSNGAQNSPQIIPDGESGSITVWIDERDSQTKKRDIYGQKIKP